MDISLDDKNLIREKIEAYKNELISGYSDADLSTWTVKDFTKMVRENFDYDEYLFNEFDEDGNENFSEEEMAHLDELKNDPTAREERIAQAGLAYYRACQKLARAQKLGIFSHDLTVDFKLLVSTDGGASFGDNFLGDWAKTSELEEDFYNLFDAGQFETSQEAVAAALNHPTTGWEDDTVLSYDMSPEYDENPYCYWLQDEDEDLDFQSDVKGLSFSGLDVREHRVFDGNRLLHDILSAIKQGTLCLKTQLHESSQPKSRRTLVTSRYRR